MENIKKEKSLLREAWDRTKKFVLPEEVISLKVLFDNIRNYLMCAAVLGALAALGGEVVAQNGAWPWSLTVFVVFLVGGNVFQSWLIIERLTRRIGQFQGEVRPRWGKLKRRLMRVFLLLLLFPVLTGIFQGLFILFVWALNGAKPS